MLLLSKVPASAMHEPEPEPGKDDDEEEEEQHVRRSCNGKSKNVWVPRIKWFTKVYANFVIYLFYIFIHAQTVHICLARERSYTQWRRV